MVDTHKNVSFGTSSTYEVSYYQNLLKKCNVSRQSSLLEIGFGNGGFLSFCARGGIKICGTEANSTLVDAARECGFDVGMADDLNRFPAASFDAIFSLDVIEPSETINFLNSCLRVLKPGGRLLLRFPNGDSPFSVSNFNADITHRDWISTEKMQYYAINANVNDVRIYSTPQIILTLSIRLFFYNMINVPVKFFINQIYKFIFYSVRKLNFVAVDLVAVLTK